MLLCLWAPLQGAASGAIGSACRLGQSCLFVKTFRSICWTALPLLLSAPYVARAQDMLAYRPPPAPVNSPPAPTPVSPASTEAPAEVAFSADQLVYEESSDTVTASGTVRMNREGYNLRADTVTW